MPEPRRVGLGGHLGEWLGVDNARGVLQRLLRYAQECGPVARVTLGPASMVFVSDASIAAELLDDPRANFKGATYILTRAVLDNVLLLNGSAWETHRKTYRQALRDVDVASSANEVTSRWLDRLGRGELDRPDGTIRLDLVTSRLVGDVVGDFVAGIELTDAFDEHRSRVQYELAGVGIDLQCQPWMYLSPMRWIQLFRAVGGARAFFRAEAERRRAGGRAERRDILNGFVRLAREGAYPDTAEAIQDGAVNFFFTAHDVLASSTSWCLYLLAKHPAEQRALREALRRLPGPTLTRAALDECTALGEVVREALRLFPGYALFGRTTQAEMSIGGYAVPRGTTIIVSPFVTHRLERHWPEPEAFRPSRWRGESHGPIGPTARGHYLPFGSGARGCLASHLALPVMKTIVAEVVRGLELRVDPALEPKIAYWGTAYPENGITARIERAT
jgi:cytochrome P450